LCTFKLIDVSITSTSTSSPSHGVTVWILGERVEAHGRFTTLQHALQELADRGRRERLALDDVALAVQVDGHQRRVAQRQLEAVLERGLVAALHPRKVERLAAHLLGGPLERVQVRLAAALALAAGANVRQHRNHAARLAAAKSVRTSAGVSSLILSPLPIASSAWRTNDEMAEAVRARVVGDGDDIMNEILGTGAAKEKLEIDRIGAARALSVNKRHTEPNITINTCITIRLDSIRR